MPRIARKDLETGFFHIMVQGINREDIFYKKEIYITTLNFLVFIYDSFLFYFSSSL